MCLFDLEILERVIKARRQAIPMIYWATYSEAASTSSRIISLISKVSRLFTIFFNSGPNGIFFDKSRG